MKMTMPVAATRIARAIRTTEASFDQALLDTSSLMAILASARMEADVEAAAGQAAFVRLAKAQSMLVDAQSELFRSHSAMRDFAQERGDIPDECPDYLAPGTSAAA